MRGMKYSRDIKDILYRRTYLLYIYIYIYIYIKENIKYNN